MVLGLVVFTAAGSWRPASGSCPGGARAPVSQTVPTMSWLEGVACQPDRTCLGVGEQGSAGAVVVFTPDGIRPARLARGTLKLNGISCLPGRNCIAVGEAAGARQ